MTEGDVALTTIPQVDGRAKPRPVILLRQLPPFGDWLIRGVSTQLHQEAVDFDELIDDSQPDYRASGLKATSLIRLGFLAVIPARRVLGVIGSISPERHLRLLNRLATRLLSPRST